MKPKMTMKHQVNQAFVVFTPYFFSVMPDPRLVIYSVIDHF